MRATRARTRARSLRKRARSSAPSTRHSAAGAVIAAATLINVVTSIPPAPPIVKYVDPREQKITELGKICMRRDRMAQQIINSSCASTEKNRKSLKRINARIVTMQKQLKFSATIKDVSFIEQNYAITMFDIVFDILIDNICVCMVFAHRSTEYWTKGFRPALGLCLPTHYFDFFPYSSK